MQTARVLQLLLPGLRIRCSVLSKSTAAGTDFSKVRPLPPFQTRCLPPGPALPSAI